MKVRSVDAADAEVWLELRSALWPDGTVEEHREDIRTYFAKGGPPREPLEVLLAEENGVAIGLAELSLRAYAEGCDSSPVAYLEGWYVAPEARRRGVGRALVAAAEAWARSLGCSELASDTNPDNTTSAAAHLSIGFSDVGYIRCFRKSL